MFFYRLKIVFSLINNRLAEIFRWLNRKKYQKGRKNLVSIKKVCNFATLLKQDRGVAQLVRVRVWGA